MNLISEQVFLELTPEQREALINEEGGIAFYYPEWEDIIMDNDKLRTYAKETLQKLK